MNYFLKKRNSRLLTVLLVLILVASMLTGCFGSKEDPTDSAQDNVPPGLVDVKPTTEPTEATETEPVIDGNSAVVNQEQVNVLSSPSTTGKVIGYLDKGDVVEVGDHASLMEKKGFYYKLYAAQFE